MINTGTIAAISTAYGEAGIGIVRMSGPSSLEILKKVFKGRIRERYMCYGHIVDPSTGSRLDEVLAVYMPGPHSYTGEDIVEIQCHGSAVSYKNILSLLLREGAEPAERGEFTKRAFLNGRLDLSQAEAVIDLIKARADKSFDAALGQLGGSVTRAVASIRSMLLDLLVSLTVNMDYPDEDIEQLTYSNMLGSLSLINDELNKLKAFSREGRIIREGLSVAIAGKPNVGKSSLMNALLRTDRSIVTDVPGTTRDTIEEQANIRGIAVNFIDTAGIHESTDTVESIGIERSRSALSAADLVLLVIDSGSEADAQDKALLELVSDIPHIIVLNKCDRFSPSCLIDGVKISALTGEGLSDLEDAIERFVTGGSFRREEDALITNARHINLIDRSSLEIMQAIEMTERAEAMDFIEINVRAAFDLLGEIIGETASDAVIEEVFSRFCLGK